MKRIIVVLLFIVIIAVFVGCANAQQPIETTTSSSNISEFEPENDDAPCVILFDSEEDFSILKQALLLSDEELSELDLDSFIQCIEGQTQKERLENIITVVEKIAPMLPRVEASQTQYADFKIYPHTGQFALMYQLNSGQRYMITLSPKSDHISTVNGELSTMPTYANQKIGPYEFDLYEYNHLGIRNYFYGEYVSNNFIVSIMIDPPINNDALIFDQFYFDTDHTD